MCRGPTWLPRLTKLTPGPPAGDIALPSDHIALIPRPAPPSGGGRVGIPVNRDPGQVHADRRGVRSDMPPSMIARVPIDKVSKVR